MTSVHATSTEASGPPSLTGLIAAVATPLTTAGALDAPAFERTIAMLLDAGVAGICLGGATAEYPHFTLDERVALIRQAARLLRRDAVLVVGIGAASPRDVVPLGRAALDEGARAVLLSMPLFFPYAQDDLDAFSREVAAQLQGPVLLYDLPSFTTPLETDTVLTLLEQVPNIVGIKDSSGARERLPLLVEARGDRPWRLIVGDDRVLPDAMAAGWDGSISGMGGICPELLVALTAASARGDAPQTSALFGLLQELIAQASVFPTPWAIRLGLTARGIETGPLPLPSSARRRTQIAHFHAWFPGWLERVAETLGPAVLRS